MIFLDFETRSRVDLKKVGTSVYARHPSTEILCLAYTCTGQSSVCLWNPGQPKPQSLLDLISWGELVEAHNVFFERNVWRWICHEKFRWPDIPFDAWRCSLAACSRLALPRSLEDAGDAINAKERKDTAGGTLMLQLCKPKVVKKTSKTKPLFDEPSGFDETPSKLAKLYEYCKQDVRAEVSIHQATGDLPKPELKLWKLDQRINLRGVPVDIPGVKHAIRIAEEAGEHSRREIGTLTKGEVASPSQVKALLKWLEKKGVGAYDLTKETVEELLSRDYLSVEVKSVLEIRKASAKASVAKLQSMLDRCDSDGRVRGHLVYHGAATGRWAGAGVQVHNFPRGTLSGDEIEMVHRVLPSENGGLLDLLLGSPLDCLSSCLRSFIKAPEGNRFIVGDFASIEARVLAWLAGEAELLSTFAGGGDPYVVMASKIYSVDEAQVIKSQRAVGKVAILGLGYGMGAKAFQRTCKVQAKIELDRKSASTVVKLYRDTNPRIRAFWGELNTACIRAIETSKPHRVGRLVAGVSSGYLQIKLPSGRPLHYREPRIVEVLAPWSDGFEGEIIAAPDQEELLLSLDITLGKRVEDRWLGCRVPKYVKNTFDCLYEIAGELTKSEPQFIKQIEYMGIDSQTKQWSKQRTYGGCLVENVTQAVARDFLAEAMIRIEEARYPIIATVHDEIVCELENGTGSLEEFEQLMRTAPVWGLGCPIEVEGFEAARYRK